jgi:hypothetical protein
MTSTNIARRFRELDPATAACIGALIVLPALLLAINRSWVFAQAGWLDPWIYSGYHMHLASLWREAPNAYYGARLPWTAIGWIAYRIAGVEAYLYILAMLLFYTSVFSLFYTIRSLFKSSVGGFVAACLLATNPWFLWSIGWHYIDGPMNASILLSVAALTSAARGKRWRPASVLWGAAFASVVALFSPNVVLLPIFAGMFVALNYLGLRRPLARVGLLWAAGFAGATLVMCFANWSLGGWFFFFAPQFEAAIGLVAARTPTTLQPWSVWAWSAPWLFLPAFGLLASVAVIALRGRSVVWRLRAGEADTELVEQAHLLTLAAACLVTTAGFIAMEAMRLGMLRYSYHANELWPFDFLIFGGCLAVGLSRVTPSRSYIVGIGAALVCLAPMSLAAWVHALLKAHGVAPSPDNFYQPRFFSGPIVEPLWMLAGAALFVGVAYVRSWFVYGLALAFISLVSITTILDGSSYIISDDGTQRNKALAIYDIARFIDTTQLESGQLTLWWDPKDRNLPVFQSLYELMYLHYNPTDTIPSVAPGDRVIFLSSDRALPATEETALAKRQLEMLPIAKDHVDRGSVHIAVTIADIAPSSARYWKVAIPLSQLNIPPPAGSISARVASAAQPWYYAAVLPIPQAVKREHPGRAYVRVRLQVEEGQLGVGVTLPDGNTFIERKFYFDSPRIWDVYLTVPALKDAKQIVVTNGGAPIASHGRLYSAEILSLRP